MSPNVGNFVHDLVEMAKAMETLPQVQAELAQAYKQNTADLETIQRLELKLLDRSNELDILNQRIRSLEVERDDAQFHALEADDRTSRALDFIKATFGNAGSLIQALEPARPAEPVTKTTPTMVQDGVMIQSPATGPAEPEGLHTTQPQGQSEDPLPSANTGGTDAIDHIANQVDVNTPINPVPAPSPSPAPEVAQPHPTPSPTVASDASGQTLADTKADASDGSSTDPTPKPFAGKLYSEVVKSGSYPTRAEWEANGGTIDNWYA